VKKLSVILKNFIDFNVKDSYYICVR